MPDLFVPKGRLRLDTIEFEGTIANDAKLVARMPTDTTYDRIDILCQDAVGGRTKAEILADIVSIRLYVGSVVKYDLSIAQHVAREEFYRTNSVSPSNNGVLPITFSRPWMEQVEGSHLNEDSPAWGMLGESTFNIEIVLGAATGITSIKPYVHVRTGVALGAHITAKVHNSSYSSAGLETIQDIDIDPTQRLYAMHFESGLVDQVEIMADDSRILDMPTALIHQDLYDAGRTVQSGYTHIDFAYRNRHIDTLPLAMRKLRVRPTWSSGPNDYEIIIERMEQQRVRQAK